MANYFYDLPVELQTYIIQIKSVNSIRNSWYKFNSVKYALFITLNALCDKWYLSQKQSEIIHWTKRLWWRQSINKNMPNTWGKKEFEIMHIVLKRTSNIITNMPSSIPIYGWENLINSLKNIVNFEITKIHMINSYPANWDYEDLLYACLFNINYIHIELFPNLEIEIIPNLEIS